MPSPLPFPSFLLFPSLLPYCGVGWGNWRCFLKIFPRVSWECLSCCWNKVRIVVNGGRGGWGSERERLSSWLPTHQLPCWLLPPPSPPLPPPVLLLPQGGRKRCEWKSEGLRSHSKFEIQIKPRGLYIIFSVTSMDCSTFQMFLRCNLRYLAWNSRVQSDLWM